MAIEKCPLSKLHNAQHGQFHVEVRDLIAATGAKELDIENFFGTYLPLCKKIDVAAGFVRKNAVTEQLAALDNERDVILRGFGNAVKSALDHFNQDYREAAARIRILLDNQGKIALKPYDEETFAINTLLQECNEQHSADIKLLGFEEWIAELDKRNKAFDTHMKGRYTEESGKTDLVFRHVRIEIDGVYQKMIQRIDAHLVLEGGEIFKTFERALNERIERYRQTVALNQGRNGKTGDDSEPAAGAV